MAGELRRSDLLVLAALGRGRELDAAAIRKHARIGRLRTRAALKRLCERGLVRSARRDDRSLYSMTGTGSSLGDDERECPDADTVEIRARSLESS